VEPEYAELLVASAIGITDGVREEWAAYDLHNPDGIRIEVKSSAHVQSWHQGKHSKPVFAYKKSRPSHRESGSLSAEPKRQAEVYVFCLHAHLDQATLDVLDVAQWEFYVLPTVQIEHRKRSQQSITLPSLQKLARSVPYADLRSAILEAAVTQRATGKPSI